MTLATDAEVLDTLRLLNDMRQQRARLQTVVVEYLVHRHGGLRKAAKACGQSPSNFVNLRKGKRVASCELLARLLTDGATKPTE